MSLIRVSVARYSESANHHRLEDVFSIGCPMMVYFHRECFPIGMYNKLIRRKLRSYRILKRLGPNAYLLDLPEDVPMLPIFNVAELFEYHGELPTTEAVEVLSFTDAACGADDHIEDVLDVREMGTR